MKFDQSTDEFVQNVKKIVEKKLNGIKLFLNGKRR